MLSINAIPTFTIRHGRQNATIQAAGVAPNAIGLTSLGLPAFRRPPHLLLCLLQARSLLQSRSLLQHRGPRWPTTPIANPFVTREHTIGQRSVHGLDAPAAWSATTSYNWGTATFHHRCRRQFHRRHRVRRRRVRRRRHRVRHRRVRRHRLRVRHRPSRVRRRKQRPIRLRRLRPSAHWTACPSTFTFTATKSST